jgi:nuclear pore complex protein Nup98-Nup96
MRALTAWDAQDQPNSSDAAAEAEYAIAARRNALLIWAREAAATDAALLQKRQGASAEETPAPKVVLEALAKGDVAAAATALRQAGHPQAARVLSTCRYGRVLGDEARPIGDTLRSGDGAFSEADANRIVQVMTGDATELLQTPLFVRDEAAASWRPRAAPSVSWTWAQLLRFCFDSVALPTSNCATVVANFLSRFDAACSMERGGEGALPPYAAANATAAAARESDLLKRGRQYEDARMQLLRAFATPPVSAASANESPARLRLTTCPAAATLHPHASSYFATDYLTPFLVLVCVRATGISRPAPYRDAESAALHGFAATLEHWGMWATAAAVLTLEEDAAARSTAVCAVLRRHAKIQDPSQRLVLERAGLTAAFDQIAAEAAAELLVGGPLADSKVVVAAPAGPAPAAAQDGATLQSVAAMRRALDRLRAASSHVSA